MTAVATKGGYRALGRLAQDLAEVRVQAVATRQTYQARDAAEDRAIQALLARLRASNADRPGVLAVIADWEHAWLALDAAADAVVEQAERELLDLSRAAEAHLRAGAMSAAA